MAVVCLMSWAAPEARERALASAAEMGCSLYRAGVFREAMVLLDQTISLHEDEARAHMCRGAVLGHGEPPFDAALAEKDFAEARRLDPDLAELDLLEGLFRLESGRPAEAMAFLESYLVLEPGRTQALLALGQARMATGDRRGARAALVEASGPGGEASLRAEAFHLLASLAWEEDDRDRAARLYRLDLKLDPTCLEAASRLGLVLESRGELGEARALYLHSLGYHPGSAWTWNRLGWCHLSSLEAIQAWAAFDRAGALAPGEGDSISGRRRAAFLLWTLHSLPWVALLAVLWLARRRVNRK